MRPLVMAVSLLGAVTMLHAAPAEAQLSNQPYGSGGGGYGMSLAARQALMNQQLSGATPGDVLIGPGGQLLTVTQGENGLAIVTTEGGVILPQYRGRSIGMNGVYVDSSKNVYGLGGSHDTIDSWTSQLNSLGGPYR